MTDEEQPIRDESLEAYLDGLASDADRAEVVQSLETDEVRRNTVSLQARIDESLNRRFPQLTAPEAHVEEITRAIGKRRATLPFYRKPAIWLGGLVAAASIALVITSFRSPAIHPKPFFSPTPVTQLYQEAVDNGFEPYYECRDDARFTAVFASRQGIPLRLLPMPEGSSMLGLSYPGGLSRKTTVMLCEIDERPVMVFVDRLEADQNDASHEEAVADELRVYRDARDGLVFYEVSPLDSPRAIQFLDVDASSFESE